MIGDQLMIVEIGMETGKAYMRNTDTFAWRLRQQRDAMGITQFEMLCWYTTQKMKLRLPPYCPFVHLKL